MLKYIDGPVGAHAIIGDDLHISLCLFCMVTDLDNHLIDITSLALLDVDR